MRKWANDGGKRATATSFARNFPDAAEDICNGGDVDDLAYDLAVKASLNIEGPEQFRNKEGAVDMQTQAFQMLGLHAVPDSSRHHMLCSDLVNDLIIKYNSYFDLSGKRNREDAEVLLKSADYTNRVVQQAFDETVKKYKRNIVIQCFGRSEEAFRTQCIAYNTTPEKFDETIHLVVYGSYEMEACLQKAGEVFGNITRAAQ